LTDTVLLVVLDSDRPMPQALDQWARRFPQRYLASGLCIPSDQPIAERRNAVWERFLSSSNSPAFLLMVDDDQVPVPQTEALFTAPLPRFVAGARYFGKNGEEVHKPDGFVGCGCLMVHRIAAEMIGADPFTRQPEEACECLAFCRRAQAAGFWPAKVGAIGHRCLVDVLPEGEAGGYRIRFVAPGTDGVPAPRAHAYDSSVVVTADGPVRAGAPVEAQVPSA